MTNKIKILIFVFVLLFTFILRAHNYDRTPRMGNLEEMLYAWSGIYLIETGIPVSWSTLDYPKRAEVFKGKVTYKGGQPVGYVTLYKPWLDEPPLFSMLVGWFAHIYHAARTDYIPTAFIRLPVVLISTLTSIVVFLIARLISGYWTAILSMFLYGTVPIMVIGSRIAVPENLIALFFSITVYLLIKFDIRPKRFYLLPIPLMAGLAGLAKPTGFFILPIAIFFTLLKRNYNLGLLLFLATLPFIIFFFWYGINFDNEIFWKIFSIQGQRPVGFSSLGWFFITPGYDWKILIDSWYIFCLLAASYFIFAPNSGTKRWISFAFVYWIIIVMFSGGEGDLLSWYRYPSFPFLAILGVWGLQLLIQKADFFSSFLIIGLLLGNRYLLINAFHPNISPITYRLIITSLLVPSLVNVIYQKEWLKSFIRVIMILVILVGIYFNIKYIYNEYEISCQGAECIFGPQTFLSTLHFPFIWRLFVI